MLYSIAELIKSVIIPVVLQLNCSIYRRTMTKLLVGCGGRSLLLEQQAENAPIVSVGCETQQFASLWILGIEQQLSPFLLASSSCGWLCLWPYNLGGLVLYPFIDKHISGVLLLLEVISIVLGYCGWKVEEWFSAVDIYTYMYYFITEKRMVVRGGQGFKLSELSTRSLKTKEQISIRIKTLLVVGRFLEYIEV